MNDITALIESLKEPAKQAIELGHIKNYAKGRHAVLLFQSRATAANVLALVEALGKAQQYAKARDEENQSLMLTVGRLRVERESLESRTVTVKSLTPEVCNALKAEGLADVLRDAAEYAPLTAGQWVTLTKNWHQTFIGLSGDAAGIQVIEGGAPPAPQPSRMSGIMPDYEGVAMTQRECYMAGKKAGLAEARKSPVIP